MKHEPFRVEDTEGFRKAAAEARRASRAFWSPGGEADRRYPIQPLTPPPWPYDKDIAPLDWPAVLANLPVRGPARFVVLGGIAGTLLSVGQLDPHLAAQLTFAFSEVHCDPPISAFTLGRLINAVAEHEVERLEGPQ